LDLTEFPLVLLARIILAMEDRHPREMGSLVSEAERQYMDLLLESSAAGCCWRWMGIRWTTAKRERGEGGGSDDGAGMSNDMLGPAITRRLSRIDVCLAGIRNDERRLLVVVTGRESGRRCPADSALLQLPLLSRL
jgi:hypothetical protein